MRAVSQAISVRGRETSPPPSHVARSRPPRSITDPLPTASRIRTPASVTHGVGDRRPAPDPDRPQRPPGRPGAGQQHLAGAEDRTPAPRRRPPRGGRRAPSHAGAGRGPATGSRPRPPCPRRPRRRGRSPRRRSPSPRASTRPASRHGPPDAHSAPDGPPGVVGAHGQARTRGHPHDPPAPHQHPLWHGRPVPVVGEVVPVHTDHGTRRPGGQLRRAQHVAVAADRRRRQPHAGGRRLRDGEPDGVRRGRRCRPRRRP